MAYLLATLLRILTFSFGVTGLANGWQRYAESLQMATPNMDGVYEFDLLIEERLTMARPLGLSKRLGILDYSPDTKSWTQRDQNIFTDCNRNYTVLSDEDNALKEIEVLEDVLQHSGLHRRTVTVNGRSPGEVIVVPQWAEVVMRVWNELHSESVTIHLHGMDKRGQWYTDGVAFVQQCPIPAGSFHTYRFIADTIGTQWYHGHLMGDRGDGLLGGFVVVDQEKFELFPETEEVGRGGQKGREYYAILQDLPATPTTVEQWLHHHHLTMKWVGYGFDEEEGDGPKKKCWAPKRLVDGSNLGGSIPLTAIMVDDKGWHDQGDLRSRSSRLPLTTFQILPRETIRLRLVNGGISHGLTVWIEDHVVEIVAADGVDVAPVKIDALMLFPGERYDLLVHGLEQPTKKTYRIIIETLEFYNWDWSLMGLPQVGLANLEYERVKLPSGDDALRMDQVDFEHRKCTSEAKCQILNCPFGQFPATLNYSCISAHKLESVEIQRQDAELIAKREFQEGYTELFVNMNFDNHIDGWIYRNPKGMPYYYRDNLDQVAVRCDIAKCNRSHSGRWDHDCDCFFHYKFSLGSFVQMKVAYPNYHEENGTIKSMNVDLPCSDVSDRCVDLIWANPSWMNGNVEGMQKSPSLRDTVNIPVGGYVVLRFRASNPGWWFAHCHLLLHHIGGTAFAFRVGEHDEIPPPPDGFPHSCGVYEQEDVDIGEWVYDEAISHKVGLGVILLLSMLYTLNVWNR